MKHVVTVYSGERTLPPRLWPVRHLCQSACKTSCTVGNQVCVNKG